MDLLKYLEPMKNLPERFSNLAFWRGVRKLRDEVVNAFEYVDSWGESIEASIDAIFKPNDLKLTHTNITRDVTVTFTTFTSLTNAKKGIKLNSSSYTLDIECKIPTTGYIVVQFFARDDASSTSNYDVVIPVLLYPNGNSCNMFLKESVSLYIPTTQNAPSNVNVSLHYFT